MSRGYLPQLDGLRCVAVYLVLVFHTQATSLSGGFIGVDLFFVLSGFLITSVILAEIDRDGRFSLGGFYARRVRRLLPAAVLVIVVTCVLQLLVASEPARISMVADARASLLYVANWQFIHDANDYFGSGVEGSPFLHFWTLSIEEQFYVAYPLLLLVVLVRLRWSRRRLAVVLAVLTAVSIAWQVHAGASDVNGAYYATQTRIYQPLAGCLLALAIWSLRESRDERRTRPTGVTGVTGLVGTVGLLGILVLATDLVDVSQSTRGLLCTVVAVAAIGGLALASTAPLARLLALPWPRYLGQISYGVYLWHWPVILVLGQVFAVRPLVLAALAGTIATGLAALSFQLVETPIRRARPLGRVPWPVVGSGLALSVVVALLVVPPVLESPRRPALAAGTSETTPVLPPGLESLSGPVPVGIDYKRLIDDHGDTGAPCDDGDPASCVVVDGTADRPLVVLVGDSHAAMLTAGLVRLAEEHEFRLSTAIVNDCPWQRDLVNGRAPADMQARCEERRAAFYEKALPEMDADLVVLSSKARSGSPRWERQVRAADAADHPDETYDQMMLRKAAESVDAIRETGARAAIVHSVVGTGGYDLGGFDPLDCLARAAALADCAVVPPPSPPPVDAAYTWLATTVPDTYAVELRPAYCPAGPICSPVVDDTVTWHDPNHLSTDFVVAHADEIWSAFRASNALIGLDFA